MIIYMNIRSFLLFIFLTWICLLQGQDKYDQLKIVYKHLLNGEKYDSALVVAKQMSAWALKNETDTSLRYAVSLRYIGNCFKTQLDSTKYYYQFSINQLKKQRRENHPDYATCLNNLGVLYYEMGDYKSAELFWKKVPEIRKKVLGEEHPEYAHSLNNLGTLYREMGDYKSADHYLKQALEIIKNALGESHPDYAASLNNLGTLYREMGDYKSEIGRAHV